MAEDREKAEKWNDLCEGLEYGGNTPVGDILQELNLIDRDNKLRRKKLEAVETYLVKLRNQAKKTGDIFERGFCTGIADNLEKILEGAGRQSKGVS